MESPNIVLSDLERCLSESRVPYAIVGSFASSIQGEFRATNDIDVICLFQSSSLDQFVNCAKESFLVDELALTSAFEQRRSFNIFHKATAFKVDLFMSGTEEVKAQIARANLVSLPGTSSQIRVASVEDTIQSKLDWYLKSNRVLDSQVRDVRGLLEVNLDDLSIEDLLAAAEKIGAKDVLEKILSEVVD